MIQSNASFQHRRENNKKSEHQVHIPVSNVDWGFPRNRLPLSTYGIEALTCFEEHISTGTCSHGISLFYCSFLCAAMVACVCSVSVRLCVHTVKPPADSCLCTGHMQPSALSLHRLGFRLHPLSVVCRCLLLTITPLSVASLPFGLWLPGVLDDEQQRNADYLAGGEPTLCVVAQVGVFLLGTVLDFGFGGAALDGLGSAKN
jgi:hypothetical protein